MLTVFFPCSPMPFTGFTAVVKRSETIDLSITMEQALQYMVSCGVVAPPHELEPGDGGPAGANGAGAARRRGSRRRDCARACDNGGMGRGRTLRIGTRGSKLARWQSDWVAARLTRTRRRGRDRRNRHQRRRAAGWTASPAIGAQGVFTKEIQSALLAGAVDLAVHSLKDLPTQPTRGCSLPRCRCAKIRRMRWLRAPGGGSTELPSGARVGTGSLRRRAQLAALAAGPGDARHPRQRRHAAAKAGRGRVRRDRAGRGGAESAGLGESRDRAARRRRGCCRRRGRGRWRSSAAATMREAGSLVAPAGRCRDAGRASTAERAVLAALHGGCSAPIAAWGRVSGAALVLDALVAALDGRRVLRASGIVRLAGESADCSWAARARRDLLAAGRCGTGCGGRAGA